MTGGTVCCGIKSSTLHMVSPSFSIWSNGSKTSIKYYQFNIDRLKEQLEMEDNKRRVHIEIPPAKSIVSSSIYRKHHQLRITKVAIDFFHGKSLAYIKYILKMTLVWKFIFIDFSDFSSCGYCFFFFLVVVLVFGSSCIVFFFFYYITTTTLFFYYYIIIII